MAAISFSWRVLGLSKVIDGDTVDLLIDRGFYDTSRIRFRLVDINTPELNSTDEAERAEAQLAKAYAATWFERHSVLGVGHDIHVTSFKPGPPLPDGGFGRWLGAVSCACGAFLSDDLLSAGLAEKS